jgi:hypothetical protein
MAPEEEAVAEAVPHSSLVSAGTLNVTFCDDCNRSDIQFQAPRRLVSVSNMVVVDFVQEPLDFGDPLVALIVGDRRPSVVMKHPR